MNIFVLDLDFAKNAEYHTDSHVSKMILETAQLLCYAHYNAGTDPSKIPYKENKAHLKHPCALWTSESISNYDWLCMLGISLFEEFKYRRNKLHKSYEVIQWAIDNRPSIKDIGITPFALAMPGKYRKKDPVRSYRDYYINDKNHLFKWTKRDVPEWVRNV